MHAKRQSISFFLLSGIFLFLLQQATRLRPLRFSEDEVLTWLLVLGLFLFLCFITLLRKRFRVRVLLEPIVCFFVFQGLWVGARWGFSYPISFAILFLIFVMILFGTEAIKQVFYSFGAALFALVYAFVFSPIHLVLLFGGLMIYDTLVFRDGVALPWENRLRDMLVVENEGGTLPLSYHVFPLIFLAHALYLHPGFAVAIWTLFLIGLSRPVRHFRETILLFALTLLLPYSLSIFLFSYAS